VLALANGAFLYLAPGEAEAHYAWPLAPELSAASIGAGYLAGAVGVGLAIAVGSWRMLRPLAAGLVVLSVCSLVATLIDADRFRWDYPPTWLWTAVYASVPVALVLIWRAQERVVGPAAGERRPPPPLALTAIALGVALLAAGVALFIAPSGLLEHWPWELTPLVSRVLGAWHLLAATVLVATAVLIAPPDRTIPFATVGTWAVLLGILPLIHSGSIETGGLLWIWLGLLVVTAAACAWGCLASAPPRRTRGY
jgi:hypothetical protein